LAVVGFELNVSTTWTTAPKPIFALVIFHIGSCVFA
jgi:hypothetical protein